MKPFETVLTKIVLFCTIFFLSFFFVCWFVCVHSSLVFAGLVELYVFQQLLPHLECGGARLAVLLRIPRLPVGEQIGATTAN